MWQLKELQRYTGDKAKDRYVVTVIIFITFLTAPHEPARCRVGNSAQSHSAVDSLFVFALHRGVARPGKCRGCGVANECRSRIQFGCVWVWFRRVFSRLLPV